MKLPVLDRAIDLSGASAVKQFTVRPGRHIMTILSNLYTDPLPAIVREYLTNMNDAYVALRKKNPNAKIIPPILHLPTALRSELIFKDFGVGMSVDQVWDIYFEYGNSTKNDGNDETGGFGLGCKSAFCYQGGQHWTIESRYDGMAHTFFAYLDKEGIPTGAKISSVPTDEPNGMTIQIPIRRQDIAAVNAAAKKYVPFFPMEIKVENEKIEKPEYSMTGSNWGYLNKDGGGNEEMTLVMGGVPYPVKEASLGATKTDYYGRYMHHGYRTVMGSYRSTRLVMTVPIGSVDLVPSRDDLMYTDKTKKTIETQIKLVISELTAQFAAKQAAAKTEWDRFLTARNIHADLYTNGMDASMFGVHGSPTSDYRFPRKKIPTDTQVFVSEATRGGYPDKVVRGDVNDNTKIFYDFDKGPNLGGDRKAISCVFINDLTDTDKGFRTIGMYFRSLLFFKDAATGRVKHMYSRHGSALVFSATHTANAVSDILGGYPLDRIILASSLNVKPLRKPSKKRNKTLYRLSRLRTWVSRAVVSPTSTGPHYYLILEDKNGVIQPTTNEFDLRTITDWYSFESGYKELYGVLANNVSSLDSTWVNVETDLDTVIKGYIKNKDTFEVPLNYLARVRPASYVSIKNIGTSLQRLDTLVSRFPSTKNHMPELVDISAFIKKHGWIKFENTGTYKINELFIRLTEDQKKKYTPLFEDVIKTTIDPIVAEAKILYDSIVKKYPIVKLFDNDVIGASGGTDIFTDSRWLGIKWKEFLKILFESLDNC